MTLVDAQIQDQYPTRVDPAQGRGWIERAEPTVHPGVTEGPASAKELTDHARDGFHIQRDLLSGPEVSSTLDELRAMVEDPGIRADERTITEPASDEVRSVFDAHLLSERIARLIREPRILDRARQILGSDVYVHQSRVNFMPGFRGNGFYWHSDFETWHAEDGMPRMGAVSLSIGLTDNYPFNGGLMLMPGAHRTFVPCLGRTPDDNYRSSLKAQKIGVPQEEDIAALAHQHGIEQFTGPSGSALWFDCNSMHGSGNNITPYPRSNIFVVFNSVDNALVEPFSARERRPGFVAARDFTPLRS
ncbi:ectoine hydroxylase [Nocardiopsis sp. L17-MgMaSL7]|uniref:ectoine hydroxylase n=1 Tax=Nocardiopsis sp. L17-MgMaSL7 TaxID=1938893 RepID=UPI000D70F4A4|nr:ectoine hydroxylase [Nocardiopsis sp. L17-MgMaSL7]PWV57387.1 ectoine hydroxylase [Nocardiopsis sp. L17-MgMaSL7]